MEYTQPTSGEQALELEGLQRISNRVYTSFYLDKDVEREIRMGFVRKVYALLSFQLAVLAVCAGYVYNLQKTERQLFERGRPPWHVALFVYVAISCAADCCPGVLRNFPLNYGILLVLTLAQSVLVAAACIPFTWESVLLSAGLTSGVFMCLTVYACLTKRDWTGYGPYVAAGMMAASVCFVAYMVLGCLGIQFAPMFYVIDTVGVISASAAIVFDTQLMMGEYWGHKMQFQIDDYCLGVIHLSLDIMHLFFFILRLAGQREDDE
mmetsp:Transcript_69232/g.166016  ORF Transcript_69232/g.166016 Transcript_69232/m.166016 type:complete len:265 (-) Transcript_69232:232-1026(-)